MADLHIPQSAAAVADAAAFACTGRCLKASSIQHPVSRALYNENIAWQPSVDEKTPENDKAARKIARKTKQAVQVVTEGGIEYEWGVGTATAALLVDNKSPLQ